MKKRRSAARAKASGKADGPGSRRSTSGLERFSAVATRRLGGPAAFVCACAVVAVWAASGPFFGFSETWQLVINTSTTIVTFLMVFLIQRSQNKESLAIQLKLNELVAAVQGASNRLIDVEGLGEAELDVLRKHFHALADLSARDGHLQDSHSVEEAEERHHEKRARRRKPANRAGA